MDPCACMKSVIKSIFFNPTNDEEVLQTISNLKNTSAGFDDIDMKIIKSVKCHILAPLVHVLNLSFAQGKVPDECKVAKVVPIHKRNDKQIFTNYRPVSVLSAFSKILEKLA